MSEDILGVTTGSEGLRCQNPTIQRQLATDKELFGPKYKQCQSRETPRAEQPQEGGWASHRQRESPRGEPEKILDMDLRRKVSFQ